MSAPPGRSPAEAHVWIVGMLVGCSFGLGPVGEKGNEGAVGTGLPGVTPAVPRGSGQGAGEPEVETPESVPGGSGDTADPGSGESPDPVTEPRAPEAGELVITEIMASPHHLDDDEGEWIELTNVGSAPLKLDGLEVSDGQDERFTVTTTAVLEPGKVFVLAVSADSAVNGGFTADSAYDHHAFHLSDHGDRVVVSLGNVVLDEVAYDGAFPMGSGTTLSLDPGSATASGNDVPTAWCAGSIPYGNGDNLGTPGIPNPGCP